MARAKSALNKRALARNPVKQMVRSMIAQRLEHKLANAATAGIMVLAGAVFPITQSIIEGDGIDQRAGRVIRLEHIQWRFRRTVNTLTNLTSSVRAILVMDTMNQGVAPVVADIISGGSTTSYYNLVNLQQRRFRILHDTHESLCSGGNNHKKCSTYDIPLNTEVHYGAATNVAAANSRNAVFLLLITDVAVSGPDFEFNMGLRFTDA